MWVTLFKGRAKRVVLDFIYLKIWELFTGVCEKALKVSCGGGALSFSSWSPLKEIKEFSQEQRDLMS